MISPSLVFFKESIAANIARMIEIAGSPQRLRPHVKTHKTREIARMELDAGITKHKCATLAEAEMLAGCGVNDILLAYQMVGPNCARLAQLVKTFPQCRFATTLDHAAAGKSLSDALTKAGQKVTFLLDVDVGQHRTGIEAGRDAENLYEQLARLPGLEAGGLHVYDGHNHQSSHDERAAAVQQQIQPVLAMRDSLQKKGLPVPAIVAGGTPTFSIYAKMTVPGLECSPGTCVLHDDGYGTRFTDLAGFIPAALLLTRVIGRPTAQRQRSAGGQAAHPA
jgi:D-serine deaminase-like pyridoxal phosphate-dependent protein